jgi:hypothetical protein
MMADLPPCRTCAAEDAQFGIKTPPADHLATVKLTDDTLYYWPVCASHLPYAMTAGWFPILDAGTPEADAALSSDNSQGEE